MRYHFLSVFTLLVELVVADVRFLTPAAGSSSPGGGALSVSWQDSGAAPSISDLVSYQLFLCAGGNDESTIVQLQDLVLDGKFPVTGNVAEAVIQSGVGASAPANAYFLKMISVVAGGGIVINYSSRFSMTGMTGSFPESVMAGLKTVSGTDGPPSINNIAQLTGATAAADSSSQSTQSMYSMPFAEQSGPLRYASMQKVPPTKITKKTESPVNAPSPYTIATTFLPPATSIRSTVTQARDWQFSQLEHTASPAAMPSDDMHKFLNRWRD